MASRCQILIAMMQILAIINIGHIVNLKQGLGNCSNLLGDCQGTNKIYTDTDIQICR